MSRKANLFATGATLGATLLAIMVLLAALFAAVLMFGLQLINDDVPAVPALGFLACFGVNLVLGTIASAFKSSATIK